MNVRVRLQSFAGRFARERLVNIHLDPRILLRNYSSEGSEAAAIIQGKHSLAPHNPIRDRVPVLQRYSILFGEKAIQKPNRMTVKLRQTLLIQKRIIASKFFPHLIRRFQGYRSGPEGRFF